MTFYSGRKVLVTGASGFLGRHLLDELKKEGAEIRATVHSTKLDIGEVETVSPDLTNLSDLMSVLRDVDYVFHLALARDRSVGNSTVSRGFEIEFNTNMLMNSRVLEACRLAAVRRVLICSSEEVYPEGTAVCSENDSLCGPTGARRKSYSLVKQTVERQAEIYAEDFGFTNIAIVRPSIVYGPGDYSGVGAAVVPALIDRALGRQNPFVVWGSGENCRDFVYARDVARGMMLALEKYARCDPLNLCSGMGVKISELAHEVIELAGYNPELVFDKSKPDGLSRVLSTEKAKDSIGFEAQTTLKDGLRETFDWYQSRGTGA